jgi:hypothetical protein
MRTVVAAEGGMDKYDLELAERLRHEINQRRIASINTDLDVAMKSVVAAATEASMGRFQHAGELLVTARKIHDQVHTYLANVDDAEEQERLRSKHQTLADAIRKLEDDSPGLIRVPGN